VKIPTPTLTVKMFGKEIQINLIVVAFVLVLYAFS
jgi:hypothetical protein